MKVCMLTSSYPRDEGDIAGTFVKSLAVNVARLGHEVHVLMPDDGGGASAQKRDGVYEHRFVYAPLPRLRVMGYARSLEGDRRLNRIAYAMIGPYLLSGLIHLARLARRTGCDVIHAHWLLPSGPIAALVASSLRSRLVISLHGSDAYVAEKNWLFGRVAARTLERADVVTACSADLRRRALQLGGSPDRTQVVPYGVSPELFETCDGDGAAIRRRLGINPRHPTVLALGRLVHKKGFDHLIDALPLILHRRPDAKLVLAGDGLLRDDLSRRAEALGVSAALRMPGRVAWTDVPAYMAAADVFALPSIVDAAGNVDGLPNVMLEAMAAGRPIVAARVGGVPDVIRDGENGRLVEPGSPATLAVAIGGLLDNRGEARRLGEEARRYARSRLDWRGIAETFVDLYRGDAPA